MTQRQPSNPHLLHQSADKYMKTAAGLAVFILLIFMYSAFGQRSIHKVIIQRNTLRFSFLYSTSIKMSSSESGGSAIVGNANIVKERSNLAAVQVGRNIESVRLVAVSKTKPVENIQELYEAGYRSFGENYFQELVEKAQSLPKDISWHFIGHLQSSKASKLVKEVPNLAVLETVDSVKLAGKLNNACEAVGREPLSVFVQVDTSGETTKSGVEDGVELDELVLFIKEQCPYLRLSGLMTIGAPGDMSCFDKLVTSRDRVAASLGMGADQLELSMGMSSDYEEAIRRGATSVRVGSTIFGPRLYPTKPPVESL